MYRPALHGPCRSLSLDGSGPCLVISDGKGCLACKHAFASHFTPVWMPSSPLVVAEGMRQTSTSAGIVQLEPVLGRFAEVLYEIAGAQVLARTRQVVLLVKDIGERRKWSARNRAEQKKQKDGLPGRIDQRPSTLTHGPIQHGSSDPSSMQFEVNRSCMRSISGGITPRPELLP